MNPALLGILIVAAGPGASDANAKVKELEQRVSVSPQAANWRALSDAYVAAGMYSKASNAFEQASDLYEKAGDPNAAKVLEIQSQRYETKIGMYYQQAFDPDALRKKYYSGARLEPIYGCYIGAFIDREDSLSDTFNGDDQLYREPSAFNLASGRKHAIYFMYLKYGRPFPKVWAQHLFDAGAAAHIVWEPSSLDEVQDDDYLKEFAQDAKDSGIPVFLRYAGEMNGSWVPYGADPKKYVEKFQLVAHRMHEDAPNIAMVWCPNEIPEAKIAQYFPGDDAVDWVGVNFYSVLYNDADRARGAEWMNPSDKLRFMYDHYSAKHPMMVGEWGATHLSVVDNILRPDFAQEKIAQLYTSLPRIYPRIKAVDWLCMNTIKYASPGRRLNDYSLLDVPRVATSYGRAVDPPYFLSEVTSFPECAPFETVPLVEDTGLHGVVHLSAFVKSYENRPRVQWVVNGDPKYSTDVPGAYNYDLDTSGLLSGPVTIKLIVTDSNGKTAGLETVNVNIVKGNR